MYPKHPSHTAAMINGLSKPLEAEEDQIGMAQNNAADLSSFSWVSRDLISQEGILLAWRLTPAVSSIFSGLIIEPVSLSYGRRLLQSGAASLETALQSSKILTIFQRR